VATSAAVPLRPLTALLLLVAVPGALRAELVPCRRPSDTARVSAALTRLRLAVDPCGESAEVAAVLDALTRCTSARYEICTGSNLERNVFDRPVARHETRTIFWDPDLSSALDPSCAEEPDPVRREPTASLLHELVHAAHDCAGREPGELELEAVRIENIYRRAAGLRQRRGYGVEPLPAAMTRSCDPAACSCGIPASPADAASDVPQTARRDRPLADAASDAPRTVRRDAPRL